MEEKRKYIRHKKALDVKYTCAKGPLIIESTTKTVDISAGGMRLALDENINLSDRVRISVALPWKRTSVDAIGKVVWASPKLMTSDASIERDCGVQFAWVSSSDLEEVLA